MYEREAIREGADCTRCSRRQRTQGKPRQRKRAHGALPWKFCPCGSVRIRALPLFLLTASLSMFGLDRDRTIAQFYHTGWAVADGAPFNVQQLAQTTDGYLWLGSENGLTRFDGVRFQQYDALQSRNISSLLATPDGGLWVGFRTGGAFFLKNGRALSYGKKEGLPSATVKELALDRDGIVWAATTHGLFRFKNSRWNKIGSDWGFSAEFVQYLFVDNQGKLWVNGDTNLFCLPPGAHVFQTRKMVRNWLIRQSPGGTLWLSESGGGVHAVYGQLAEFYDRSKPVLDLEGLRHDIFVDREGGMWILRDGLYRIANPEKLPGISIARTSNPFQRFTQKDGLTDDRVIATLVDHEGNIWVTTAGGLDRFRRKNVVQGPFPHSKDSGYNPVLIADQKGVIWGGSQLSLMTVNDDGVSARDGIRLPVPSRVPVGYQEITCGYGDSDGALWLGGRGVLTRFANGRFEKIEFPDDARRGSWDVQAITRDRTRDLWVSIQQHGVYRRHDDWWTHFGNLKALPNETAITLWTDPGGRVWFGYMGNKIAMLDGDQVRVFSSSEGLHIGNVTALGGRGAQIWAGGEFGLALFDGNRFRTISEESDADFRSITGVVETSNGDFWLNQTTGVAHIPAAEIVAKLQDVHRRLRYELFDFRDGVTGSATQIRPLPSAVLAGDGRIWMTGSNGTYWVDPARIYKNPLPPPVSIEAIYADDKRYDPSETSRLPSLPSNVRIEYSALSLSIPERVRFRYQLEGYDKDWQDVGTRRAAYYPKLPPGHFSFHVIACNNDGVWNQAGAAAAIIVPPAIYQSMWFRGLYICAVLGLLWMIYLLRLRQISAQMNGRLEERLAERTRIARELHDTLLQSLHGVMFRFQAARNMLPRRPEEALQVLDVALERTEQAIAEGRHAIQDLRSEPAADNDLEHLLTAMGQQLEGCQDANLDPARFRVTVEGERRALFPITYDEVYRITCELLRNAFQHARARQIEVEIRYDDHLLRVRVRDDGKGIDPKVLQEGGRDGHWGLPGIRERAKRIGARLDFWSEADAGTEAQLTIQASVAYAKAANGSDRNSGGFRVFRRKTGTHGH
jgi:signal transduction histidine kinase/ligand-binding sensor domain-containing protein